MVGGLVEAMKRLGHHVFSTWSEPTGSRVANKTVLDLHLREPDRRRLWHLASLFRSIGALLRTRPHIVHLHFLTKRAHYFLLLRRFLGFKVVITAHGSDLLRPWPGDRDHLGRFLQEADAVTVVSEDLRDHALRIGSLPQQRVEVIPNGVDMEVFQPIGGKRQPGSMRLISVGRLEHVKGHDVLLRALADPQYGSGSCELTLVGDGEERSALIELARQLAIEARVNFAGMLNQQETLNLLQNSDVFVLPSRSEGLPVALIEAMACGLPCLASDVGGVTQVLCGAGMTVEPDNPEELARCLGMILADESLRTGLSKAAIRRASSFSAALAANRYAALYKRLASSG